MTLRVCVINAKGGTGKTTVATHLAAAYAVSGLQTLLVDLDRYRSATHWLSLRTQTERLDLADWKKNFGGVAKGVQRVVIDCPASLRMGRVREIVAESDAVVVPLLPSIFDQHATKRFLRRLSEIKGIRKGRRQVLVVANRIRPGAAGAADVDAIVAALKVVPLVRISERSLYPSLAAKGRTVFDAASKGARAAQAEWMPLIETIEAGAGTPQPKAAAL